ncbi:MAG: PIG-L family deacetylase [Planctomycetota bacterium]
MSETKRILAIHAHPDDIEFQCAGTLLLLKARGHHVTVATMTPGDKGSAEMNSLEISSVRRAEAQGAAEILGADYHCLEFRDLAITYDNAARRRVTEFLRKVRPDIILTAPPVDYMADHEITSKLVRDAAFNASVNNYRTSTLNPAPILAHMPYLYYVDATEGVDYYGQRQIPEFHVDVSSVFETKQKMLACHASQRNWLLKQHGIDEYLDANVRWSTARGAEIGVVHAESFRQHRGHPYPNDNVLLRLLGLTK